LPKVDRHFRRLIGWFLTVWLIGFGILYFWQSIAEDGRLILPSSLMQWVGFVGSMLAVAAVAFPVAFLSYYWFGLHRRGSDAS
jgi:hypothetical protein